jgi:N-dimethylarginine dimethylaminohydrolase
VGVVNCVDTRLVAIHAGRASVSVRGIFRDHDYRLLELPPDEELMAGRGMNFITVGPSAVLMPAGCPGIRRRLEAEGISVRCADVSEYLKGAGGIACLTGILARDRVTASVEAVQPTSN